MYQFWSETYVPLQYIIWWASYIYLDTASSKQSLVPSFCNTKLSVHAAFAPDNNQKWGKCHRYMINFILVLLLPVVPIIQYIKNILKVYFGTSIIIRALEVLCYWGQKTLERKHMCLFGIEETVAEIFNSNFFSL